ncbi:Uncharacterised protein [Klebsiella oxytoca]|nr:Uncharacterised protein [Klebsiella oxytoca]
MTSPVCKKSFNRLFFVQKAMKAVIFPAIRSRNAAKRSKAVQFQPLTPYSTQYWHHPILHQALHALIARRFDAQSPPRSRSFLSLPAEPAAAPLVIEGNAYSPTQPYQAAPAFAARDAEYVAAHPAEPARRAAWLLPAQPALPIPAFRFCIHSQNEQSVRAYKDVLPSRASPADQQRHSPLIVPRVLSQEPRRQPETQICRARRGGKRYLRYYRQ